MGFLTKARLVTLAIGAAGAGLFWVLGLPLPFLFGPMAACLVAALSGMNLKGMGEVGTAARTVLGVAVGASITPELFGLLPSMALTLALMPFYIAIIGLIGVPFFHRLCGFDLVTSYYAAMPGGLQDMLAFGQEAGGDIRALSLIHATRVLIIVTVAPWIMTSVYGAGLTQPIGVPAADLPLHEMAILAVAAIAGWKLFERLGLFGASIIGPLVLSAGLSLSGIVHVRPPAEAIMAAQYFIGLGIGVSYVGVTLAELRRVVSLGVVFVLILAVLTAIFTEIVYLAGLGKPLETFLAFAPGGQAEMTVLAIVAGADLGFVVAHHLTRMVLVITCAPIAARVFGIRKGRPGA